MTSAETVAFNARVIEEFRANEGKVERFRGKNLLLLTTIGRRSGLERISPLVYIHDGDRLVIAAALRGAPVNPVWYLNLVANPEVTVETGQRRFAARAEVVADRAERDRLYAALGEHTDEFTHYATKTDRVIPVVTLTPQE
ncbi:nitroreductase family deazaflavin-dependent oxidoreductase [Amycolatopsis ultiminotia]|uniref:Nitroreductase family deazaflavin-dependent oxidoreductase n=1 Tax=Amycolatopsis ultiminotia TaxID=543629 RepID=A0ABP6XAF7_9PSEU